MRQEAEIKRLKAETNAQIREAQLKGLAATVKAARQQIGGQQETTVKEERIVDAAPAVKELPLPGASTEIEAETPIPTTEAVTGQFPLAGASSPETENTPLPSRVNPSVRTESSLLQSLMNGSRKQGG
jgi:hypothetical protein